MKQSEMSKRLDIEDPVCIMQIWSGRTGRLSDINDLKGAWSKYTKVDGKVAISDPPIKTHRLLRIRYYLWNLEIKTQLKARMMWHRMVRSFNSFGKSTKENQTVATSELLKTKDGKYSFSVGTTVPSQTNT